ncbi:hypothetical protein [Streptomyces sp. t39]|uniref:hypothetical protein n=1 Tax=Streptomyces sp. t39 TaxID=1828156 RepID=UPI0011CE13A2|nr:hypothetical protein [Streptomyces sp. t39]TXS50782.1 hypothetical protein EAO77_22740 [Streptomyces sp. t39]
MRGSRGVRVSHGVRPTALVSSVATLIGALFLCLGAGPAPAHHPAGEGRGVFGVAAPGHGPTPAFGCPYDRGDCGLLPVLSPAVLTAPPIDAPLQAGAEPPYTVPPAVPGGPRRSAAQPRAPDLHVLQVLRT